MVNQLPNDVTKAIESGEIEEVSGGYVFDATPEYAGIGAKPQKVAGGGDREVLGRYATREEAEKMAPIKGQTTTLIYCHGPSGLYHLRHPENVG